MSADESAWRFTIAGAEAWRVCVDAVPSEDRKRDFWERAVPLLAADPPDPETPCVVACRASAPAASGGTPGGPLGRAKGLLDALHDDRRSGPLYRELGAEPPLPDDHPRHVAGLAVEVLPGPPRTDYLLGPGLAVKGELLASVPIAATAPNDIVGTPEEKGRIAAARVAYGKSVVEAFASHAPLPDREPKALVVRHHAERDEDNTWATWIAGVCGVRGSAAGHWAAEAPLAGWAPTSVASLADGSLDTPVVYELWG